MSEALLPQDAKLVIVPAGSKSTARKHRQRVRLWAEQKGLCHWCGKPMLWVDRRGNSECKDFGDEEATIDHLYDRFDPERGKHPGEKNRVLAHRRCNHERSRVRQARLKIEEKWARANRHPRRVKR